MRVLVVDPSRLSLDALDDGIAEMRPHWQFVGTTDVEEAEDLLRHGELDAVAVAGRNGSDTLRLLPMAREACPGAVRLGLVDGAVSMRAAVGVDAAHQLLPRPLRTEIFVRTVESATMLASRLRDPQLIAALGSIEQLPAAPTLYLALMRELGSENADTDRIARLVTGEPSIAAKVLQVCNSALFSRGATVSNVQSAVVRIGLDAVHRIVLAAETMGDSGNREHVQMQRRALLASQLAVRLLSDPAQAQSAATATILADLGLLLPLGRMGAAAARDVHQQPHDIPLPSLAAAYLLGLWGIPGAIVEAVAYRHRPDLAAADDFGVVGATHVATALVAGSPVDEAYLEAVGVADRIPGWQDLLDRLRQTH